MRRLSTGAARIRASRPVLALLVSWLGACGGDGASPTPPPPPPPPPPPAVASLVINAGDQQQAAGGAPVAIAPAVLVRNAQGGPVAGVTVQFTVLEGGGSVVGGSPMSDAAGVARVTGWTLGTSGVQRLRAQVGSLPAVEFQATLTPGTETITVTLPGSGGTHQVTMPGHPYQGLTLTVPVGTYPGGNSVQMRVVPNAPLPPLPAGYRVSGPVLEVYTPEMRGAKLMTLDIPVTRAANEDVLIAFYDPTRRIIEVLPTVGRTPTSVRVMSGHLRADLLIGRSLVTAAVQEGLPPVHSTFPVGQAGYLLQIAMSLPIQPVAPVLNPAADRWPVIDHGSTYFPTGHGPAIPGLVALGAAQSAGLAQKVVPLPRPGFYADAAPLAVVVDGSRSLSTLMTSINQMTLELAKVTDKALRDEMVHHNLVGGMHISGNSSIAALMPAQGVEPVFVNTVSGTETTIAAISPAEAGMVQVNRAVAQGFSTLSVLPAGDQPPVSVDEVVPLPSFVFPVDVLNTMFGGMLAVLNAPLGSQQREAGNLQMGTFVGFPTGGMDVLPFLGGAWHSTTHGTPIAIRGPSAGLRRASPFSPPGFIMNSLPGLAEVGSVGPTGGFVSTLALADFAAAPELAQLQYIITPTGNALGGTKQTGSFTITLAKAPFKVTPSTVDLPANRKVDLVAEVPFPPTGGFWIEWHWDDGTPPIETFETLTATHTYVQPGDYIVRATLQDNTASRQSLAVFLVPVRNQSEPFWRITSLVDLDGFYDAAEDGAPQNEIEKILVNPASGLIGVTQVPGGSEMRLWAKATGVWTDTDCCPPTFSPGDQFMMLGTKPASQASLGPYFTQWREIFWLGDNLNAGSWTGRGIGPIVQYSIKDGGTQMGPDYATQLVSSAQEKNLTGTITLTLWYLNDDGELDEHSKSSFRFQFTALRLR